MDLADPQTQSSRTDILCPTCAAHLAPASIFLRHVLPKDFGDGRFFPTRNRLHHTGSVWRCFLLGTLVAAFHHRRTPLWAPDNFARFHLFRRKRFRHRNFRHSHDMPLGFFCRHSIARLFCFPAKTGSYTVICCAFTSLSFLLSGWGDEACPCDLLPAFLAERIV